MLHTSKRAHRIGLTVHFPYSLPLKVAAYIQKYAEIAYTGWRHMHTLYKANDMQVILQQSWSSGSLSVKPNRCLYLTLYVLSMCTKTTCWIFLANKKSRIAAGKSWRQNDCLVYTPTYETSLVPRPSVQYTHWGGSGSKTSETAMAEFIITKVHEIRA